MQSAPNRLDDLKTLRMVMIDVAFATAFMTLVGGAFLVGFIKHLGGDDHIIGIVSALPSLLGLMQIPGALWGRSFASFKKFVQVGGGLWRLFYLVLIGLPLLPWPNEVRIGLILAVLALAWMSSQTVDPIYNDWLAEIIPPTSRAWFYGRRGALAALVGALVGVVGGLVIDHFEKGSQQNLGYSIVFGLGALCAFISWIFFTRMQDRVRENPQPVQFKSAMHSIALPYRDPLFRRVILFLFFFVFGQAFMGGLLVAFSIEVLKLPITVLQLCGLGHAVGQLIMARWWGFFADKYGNKPVLAILTIGIVLSPVCWFFTQPDSLLLNSLILIPGHVFSGMIWGGVGAVQLNLVIASAKPEERANYIAAGQSLIMITAGVSPILGSYVMSWLRAPMGAGSAYMAVLGITTGLRLLSILFLIPVKEYGSTSLRQTLREITRANPKRMRELRQLSTSVDIEERSIAIENVGKHRLTLALDDLLKSLHDPTPHLRRQAAQALASLGDERAAQALHHQLEDHADLVEEETIEALGVLGDSRSVELLSRYLISPRSQIRRATAHALGRIGGDAAERALAQAASQEEDFDLQRAALQALRRLNSAHGSDAIIQACLARIPSVRIAAAEAVVALGIRKATHNLVQSLKTYDDEACSELAYALACVGGEEHLPLIVQTTSECGSVITRRRCLMGISHVFGVEGPLYRLLLLDGMARDAALLEMLGPLAKSDRALRAALGHYNHGEEHAALVALTRSKTGPSLLSLVNPPIDEMFLVGALARTKFLQDHSEGNPRTGERLQ
ncbi:MAG: MFS transporter [Chthonomonas sp.]|nr:MFS transporter [Chthonomonas sp.]